MRSGSHDLAGAVRRLVLERLAGQRAGEVVPVGEGEDHLAFEVDGELIVRCSKDPDQARRAAHVRREARLLAAVARISPLPVPQPAFTAADQGCLAYRKLPGLPLLELPQHQRLAHGTAVGATLGGLLGALHAAPVAELAELVERDDRPLAEWRQEAAETYGMVAGAVPAAHRRQVEAFLRAAPPEGGPRLVFSHNDLGIEHVLVDPVTVAVMGVIDWSDAALVDPARDLGLLYRDLGPAALDAAAGRYRAATGGPAPAGERAAFYARCSVFEDLHYGLRTGQGSYVDKCLAAMAWLFPP